MKDSYHHLRDVIDRVRFYTGAEPEEDPDENRRVVGEFVIVSDFKQGGLTERTVVDCLRLGVQGAYLMMPRPGLYRYLD